MSETGYRRLVACAMPPRTNCPVCGRPSPCTCAPEAREPARTGARIIHFPTPARPVPAADDPDDPPPSAA